MDHATLTAPTELSLIMTYWMVAAIVLRHRRPATALYMSLPWPYFSLSPPKTGRELRSGHTERGLPQRTVGSVRCGMFHSKQTLLTIIF